ncbi:hypothetical protein EMMF5_005190 [Cystobasidiomycetes sp. EMM_F5]
MGQRATPGALGKGEYWGKNGGYTPGECTVKEVDLLSGANYSPEYLKINTAGTVPTLVVPQLDSAVDSSTSTKYTAIIDSIPILEFLDSQRTSTSTASMSPRSEVPPNTQPAPSLAAASIEGKAQMDAIIALVHSDEADGNFLFVSARNEEELVKKGQGIVGKFLSGRIPALETYLADARKAGENERLVNFLSEKLQGNQQLNHFYKNPSAAAPFFAKSQAAWASLAVVLHKLNQLLPKEDRSGFITLADLHAGAWFARILACCGATQIADAASAWTQLRAQIGSKADEFTTLQAWWSSMISRKRYVCWHNM